MKFKFPYFKKLGFSSLYTIIILFFLVWMLFFDTNSYLTHRELNKEIYKLNKQKQFLEKEIEKDKKNLQILNTTEGKEKLGRELYYLKREHEEIFIIEYDTIN
ncbi:septum formation initiator family protein [Capnocytophaga canimorsus]|nr:septum formation initiator family protein [Capnocytophaga canimorsus]ATA76211.1 septum formation inhibitor [Capnocytophaga canimorsus]ATA90812.1 septum formation inhibitor [Capnocytophaga canimorsus]AWL77628.1 septum formation inhibitor [Capnocytophaga canimorsus]MDT9498413.1 septum formation initiator family protein [Capnocytophaga canimorsus]PJI76813.1 septum formation initiator [Capnocytophaga canimorsus]